MIKTEAGEKMKDENPVEEKQDINQDGEYEAWEQARQEAIEMAKQFEAPEMNMGGLMYDHPMMKMVVGVEEESGNHVPPGSMPEEVADDIPAMLSEGEYVVPADVVRWHGVKFLEGLRCEAKMGMGLMSQDGRIATVDAETKELVEEPEEEEYEEAEEYEETEESPEYEIEEDDAPEVEEAEVKVVHAAEGALINTAPAQSSTFYRYVQRLNPVTNRYEFVPVETTTGAPITSEEYDPARSTRYSPESIMGNLYGKDEPTECPDGFEYDSETGACVPVAVEPVQSVVQPSVGGGDGPSVDTPSYTPYSQQFTTKMAEQLGALSAEDLADYEGTTLAEKAASRMMDERSPNVLQIGLAMLGGITGMLGLVGKNIYDSVGAKRAAITRENEVVANPLGVALYNFSFDPATGSFRQTPATSEITSMQNGWATDYNNIGFSGKSYNIDSLFEQDPSGNYSKAAEDAFDDVLAAIEAESKTLTEVRGDPAGLGSWMDSSSGGSSSDFSFGAKDSSKVSQGTTGGFFGGTFDDPGWGSDNDTTGGGGTVGGNDNSDDTGSGYGDNNDAGWD